MKKYFNTALFIIYIIAYPIILLIIVKSGSPTFYFREDISPESIIQGKNSQYQYTIKNDWQIFQLDRAIVFENNHILSNGNLDSIISGRKGFFFVSEPYKSSSTLYFTSSDSSNPITNGKQYSIGKPLIFFSLPFGLAYLILWLFLMRVFGLFVSKSPRKNSLTFQKPFILVLIWNDFIESNPALPFIRFYKNNCENVGFSLRGSKKLYIALILLSVIISLITRINMSRIDPGQPDEGIYLYTAVQYGNMIKNGEMNKIINADFNYEHPIFNKLLYGVTLFVSQYFTNGYDYLRQVNGSEGFPLDLRVQVLRHLSVFFGTVEVLLLACIHPIAGILLSIHTFAVRYTSVIYLEAIGMALTLFSVWSFNKGQYLELKENKVYKWFLFSSFCLGISIASKYIFATTGIACLIYGFIWAYKNNFSQRIKYLIFWSGFTALFFFLFDPYLWNDTFGRLTQSIIFSQNYSTGNSVTIFNFPFWQPIHWLTRSFSDHGTTLQGLQLYDFGDFIRIDLLIFITAIIGLPCLYYKKPLYFVWIITCLLFLLVWKTKWPQYVTILLAPLCLSSAYGFQICCRMLIPKNFRGKIFFHK